MRIGTTVLYVLSASDVALIAAQRTTSDSIKNRASRNPPEWPAGAAARLGDPVAEGDMVPLIITRETPEGAMISGHAFLNGTDTFWVAAAELVSGDPPTPGQATELSDQLGFAARAYEEPASDRRRAVTR
jgi:hypothetical protein